MKKNIVSKIWIVLALLSGIYGFFILALGSGTKFFLIWFCIAIIFSGFAAISYFHLWSKLHKIVKILLISFIIFSLICFLIIQALIFSRFSDQGMDKLNYLIVLGAQVYEDKPSVVLKFRLDKAIEYLMDNPETKCIVSGGQGENESKPEAEVMAQYLIENGISTNRIIQENQSMTTEENLKNSIKLMEEQASVGIVTNNFHLFRALQLAKRLNIKNVYGIAASSTFFYLPNNLLREFLAYLKFLLL